jgi:choice-of-anchor A domain-containing protein
MTTLTALQILQQLDLVDFTNFTGSSDVEGRAVIGGNLISGGTFYTGASGGTGGVAPAASSFAALTVFGSVDVQNDINLNDSGTAYVGGSGSKKINFNGGKLTTTAPMESIAQLQTTLDGLESSLSAMSANGVIENPNNPNLVSLNNTTNASTVVFDVTAAELKSWGTLNLNAGSATSIIINVIGGGSISTGVNLVGGFNSDQHKIIWNFENATSVTVNGWQGTILAPYAAVTANSQINGTVVANSFSGGGEIHQYTYEGVVCFMPGTAIATPDGPRPVEALRVGDLVETHGGAPAPVLWIGRQTVSTRFGDAQRILPIRIRAGALGPDMPSRDLLVSPQHAVLVGEVLVQAGALVNGSTIVRESDVPERFTYFHVELADHSLILAEGLPAETFIDHVERLAFDNWDEHLALYPDGYEMAELPFPRVQSARQTPAAVKQLVASRALALADEVAQAA